MSLQSSEMARLPPPFVERLRAVLPADRIDEVIAALAAERATVFRLNPLRADGTELDRLAAEGFDLEALPWLPAAYRIPPGQRRALTETEVLAAGRIYIQNPASMIPPLLLCPGADDKVLDLAAAPGSKTLQLAAMMGNRGWISAVEVVRERFFRLHANLERHGATNVHTYHKDGRTVWRHVAGQFDKVLLDAPCSSEGQFNLARPETLAYWSERKIKEMARKQKQLIYSALQCLKPGGVMVYSTCTFAPEENEAIVDHALRKFAGQLQLLPIEMEIPGSMAGLTHWGKKRYHDSLCLTRRVLPDGELEGFFVALLQKR